MWKNGSKARLNAFSAHVNVYNRLRSLVSWFEPWKTSVVSVYNEPMCPIASLIYVSQDDLVELQTFAHTLEQDLANHVKAAARRHNLAFPGPVSVDFRADSELNRGQARVQAQFVEGDEIDDVYAYKEEEPSVPGIPEETMVSMDKTKGYKNSSPTDLSSGALQ